MSGKVTVTYYMTDDGWLYSDSFGCAMLEGRRDGDVGITVEKGRRVLTLPQSLDGMDVYIISFDGEYDALTEELIIPPGVGIIMPHAFWGWTKLREVQIPDSVLEIGEGAFFATAIPDARQQELYRSHAALSEADEEQLPY